MEQDGQLPLTTESTLGDLPLWNVRLSPDAAGQRIRELFESDEDLPGILVVQGRRLDGIISREIFQRQMLRPFGPDVFMNRPLRVMLHVAQVEPMCLPGTLSIQEAVHQSLQRPREARYEPIVIELDNGDVRVLGFNELLLAQSRLLEMANETIGRQKDIADAANVAKSQFLANMSHEIRTPMNGILGMTDLLLETEVSEVQREYLTLVKTSADWLVSVINDILDFSKVEAGKLTLEQIPFGVRDLLGDLMKSLAFRAHDKNLELACRVSSEVPDGLVGDPVRLRQVLTNLIGNAIKFTIEGEVVLDVRVRDSGACSVELEFAVRDTGIGIPADQVDKIFRAFEQADGSTSRRFGGTGLGLSISSRLVELMDGRIWIESRPNVGSTFRFTARFDCAAGGTDQSTMRPPLSGRRVLVVDDHPTTCEVLAEILGDWGLSAETADGIESALACWHSASLAGRRFDAALVDLSLIEADRGEALQQFREMATMQATKLLPLMTARQAGRSSIEPGFRDSPGVMKPVKASELADVLTRELRPEAMLPARAATGTGSPPRPGGPLRTLLVEDNRVNQRLATLLLEKHGHQVTVVDNGRSAVEVLEVQSFDLVLMDVQMPIMDGLAATREIRLREAATGRRVPIVAMTAHALKGDRERCLDAGMDDYVVKPIDADQLYRAIERTVPDPPSPRREEVCEQSPGETATHRLSESEPVLDWSVALAHARGDERLLKEIIDVFLVEQQELIEAMRAAIEGRKAGELRRYAHSLKGSVALFGAQGVQRKALRLEEAAASGEISMAGDALRTLDAEIQRLVPELRGFRPTCLPLAST